MLRVRFKKKRRRKKGDAFDIAGGNPQLGRCIRIVRRKNAHPFVGQCMQQVETGNKQIGRADEQNGIVLQQRPGIPDQHEGAAGHDNAKYLGQAVKQKIVVTAQ